MSSGSPAALPNVPTSGVSAPDASLAHTLSQAIVPLLPPLSLGALLGFAAGYAVRVVGKIALLIVGLLFVAIQLLSYFGLVSVNWLRLETLSGPWLQDSGKTVWTWLSGVLTHDLPFGGAFVVGLLLGLRRR
ncbi:FUN14 domain-containing protein [Deinococcus alpinitundrae]|uniref:FUN14 domain-containing protein n=1 Tax=Deinococcus alpinitundrae TaxID=468913 RepID=UPI00137AC170|nr:FUN14 domain-containing protein [Deinococcus alpinitundrae]